VADPLGGRAEVRVGELLLSCMVLRGVNERGGTGLDPRRDITIGSQTTYLHGRAERLVLVSVRGAGVAARGAQLLEEEQAGLEEAAVAVAFVCVDCGGEVEWVGLSVSQSVSQSVAVCCPYKTRRQRQPRTHRIMSCWWRRRPKSGAC
jgi:hypothetical protein